MRIALLAAGVFGVAFVVHWTWWRVQIPSRQSAVLLCIFFATLCGWMVTSAIAPDSFLAPRTIWELLHVSIFHVALALAYVVAYSAIEHRSPSMTVLTFVADSGDDGRLVTEVRGIIEADSPVEIRLAAMLRDGMILEENGNFCLTAKGRAWAIVLSRWRQLLGLPPGG